MPISTDFERLRYRRTKIVATLGPASKSPEIVGRLVEAGVDVFRLNMSHGTHASHRAAYANVRAAASTLGRSVGVFADLSGPKIRVGRLRDGEVFLADNQRVVVTVRDVLGEGATIPTQYKSLAADVNSGDRILLADGTLELAVKSVEGTEVHCEVIQGGTLRERQGINLPGVDVSAPSLTEKDIEDARFALDMGVDFLALSFVRRGADIDELKTLISEAGSHAGVIAKIERPEALVNSDEIIEASAAIMIARGDLGVELPPEEVPIAQLQLIKQARQKNKPVIVATQMLESMTTNSRPTRAEVADVSGSVQSGVDAVMLSGETAAGEHPVGAVEMMDSVARHAESYLWSQRAFDGLSRRSEERRPIPFGDAVARATALLTRDINVRAIIALSYTGMSAATVSYARPAAPILAVSPRLSTARQMNLLWGVLPCSVDETQFGDPVALARELATEQQLATPGDFILLVRGFHAERTLSTPTISLISV
ncbi:MAG: pyruvate kinase [Gammaproteobacteria bacterium]|nr:pyruvate kinase [Gammaproteobacteria bacterium]